MVEVQVAAEDLLTLNDFSEESVLETVKNRFQGETSKIFTQIGAPILLSVNPYRHLPIFNVASAQQVRDYSAHIRGQKKSKTGKVANPGPHLFMVAEDSFQQLITDQSNQSIIITGESGAGKTEACKIILSYIARANEEVFSGNPDEDLHVPGQSKVQDENKMESIETYVLDSNPLLEAFGNAKTTRNVNSSRFGKFIQVGIQTQSGNICSARILTYLLEKSRAISVADEERSFHIFYQGLASDQIRSKYGLSSANPADYGFLKSSTNTYTIPNVDDAAQCDVTVQCMRKIGFSEEEIDQIWQIIVAILNLGNVTYRDGDNNDEVFISEDSKRYAERAAQLLMLSDSERMMSILQEKVVKYPGQVITTRFTEKEAISARNSCAKTIYGKLFSWIVGKINNSISSKMNEASQGNTDTIHSLGILDIFGFESFKKNSFEQLCINYANEKLQQHFNSHMIALEMNEYKYELGAEAVANITFEDSSRCLELFESKSVAMPSLFKLIDEEGSIRGNDENLLRKFNQFYLEQQSNSNPHYRKASKFDTPQFLVNHYAGDVIYDIHGFTEKNKDVLSDHITETLIQCDHPLMNILFPQNVTGPIKRRGTKIAGFSLSRQFQEQLAQLIHTINDSVPRYVRCIKPNSLASAQPTDMDEVAVKEQLRAGSILEAVRIRKIGYGYRMSYDDFVDQFWPIIGERDFQAESRDITDAIFQKAANFVTDDKLAILTPGAGQGWQCGVTKLFIKDETKFAMESALNRVREKQAIQIQSAFRGKLAKKFTAKRLSARSTIQRLIMSYTNRQRWKKSLMLHASKFLEIVIRIQQRFRFKRRRDQIMNYFRVRKRATIRIQRAFRRQQSFEALVKNLNRRREARLRLQRAFRWRALHSAVFGEIMRRAKIQRQRQLELIKNIEEEQKEVNVLRQANARMQTMIIEKDNTMKEMKTQERSALGNQANRTMVEKMLMEITRLKQQILMLEQRLHMQVESEEHGYF